MTSQMRRIATSWLVFSLLTFMTARPTGAIEISITGNGGGSVSEVDLTVEREETVEQVNEADIDNDVDIDSNTGDNTVDGNTGEVSVETGDIDAEVSIETSANTSEAHLGSCECDQELNITIENNGAGSDNSVDIDYSSSQTTSLRQKASITNTIDGVANTGENSASGNSGTVSVRTGSISVKEDITNTSVNVGSITGGGRSLSVSASISDNGSDSNNSISYKEFIERAQFVEQSVEIKNSSDWDLNTGRNIVDGNNGDVSVGTGDIGYVTEITNEGINGGIVVLTCPECGGPLDPTDPGDPGDPGDPTDPSDPADETDPAIVSSNNSNSSSKKDDDDDDDEGDVLGAVYGMMLPATGTNWMMFATLGNIFMLLLGVYLRMRSGRAPAGISLPAYA